MKIFEKRISYKMAGVLLFIFLFFTIGTIYLILSARGDKEGKATSKATQSATDEFGDTSEESPPITLPSSGNIVTVTITSFGFSPLAVTINAGDSVEWVNNDNKDHWPASDPHPQRTDYSGFDSLGISAGSSWSFKFDNKGTWNYHDHNIPGRKGTVVVQ